MNTHSLQLGGLVYIDFFFVNIVSIRGFSAVLIIVDSKTRLLLKYCTPGKRPLLDFFTFLSYTVEIYW